MNMISEILLRSPINRVAGRVTRQRHCPSVEADITRQDIAPIIERLQRKHRLLKLVLGIDTKAKHKNVVNRFNSGLPQFRMERNPRAFVEYVRIGRETQRLNTELSMQRKARKYAIQVMGEFNASRAA